MADIYSQPIVPGRDPDRCARCNGNAEHYAAAVGRAFRLFKCIHCDMVYCGCCMWSHTLAVNELARRRFWLERWWGRHMPEYVLDEIAKFISPAP